MHHITTDPATGRIDIIVSGFWTEAHVAVFAADLAMAVRAARSGGHESTVLCDYTQAAIQPQQVVGAIQAMVRDTPVRSRRIALYTEGGLATLQARRVASVRDDIRVFGDRRSAICWLEEEVATGPVRAQRSARG